MKIEEGEPDIRSWIDRKFGELNYYVTQILPRHGYYEKYLHRMGKTGSGYCLYEERKVIDDAEHIVFESARWQIYRPIRTSIIETIRAPNIIWVIIVSRGNWASVANYVEWAPKLKNRDLEAAEHVGAPA